MSGALCHRIRIMAVSRPRTLMLNSAVAHPFQYGEHDGGIHPFCSVLRLLCSGHSSKIGELRS